MPVPPPKIFETRSQAWEDVGLARQLDPKAARRARMRALILLPLFVCVIVLYHERFNLAGITVRPKHPVPLPEGLETPVRIAAVILLLALGWWLAREGGRALGPAFFRRMDPATAGTVGFVVRLLTFGIAALVVLNIAGISALPIAVGGAFIAVILGLAAQQTLGNIFAGTVLLSARPFRVGDRVRLQGGPLAGQVEGIVSSLGLLYTTFATGDDSLLVPNSVVLNVAILPIKEPDAVTLRARLPPGMTPSDLQELLEKDLRTGLRGPPRITLQALEDGEAVVQISATPRLASQGRHLASELLEVVARETAPGDSAESVEN